MPFVKYKRDHDGFYWHIGRAAIGWFDRFAGRGWIACYSGWFATYLRLGRFVIAWKHKQEQPGIKWCYCWPKNKIIQ